jgi:hypothetical protein
MVNVSNRAHVHVRLGPLEFTFCHFSLRAKNSASGVFKVSDRLVLRPPLAADGNPPKTGL